MKKFLLISFLLFPFSISLFAQNTNNVLSFQNDDYVNINNIAPDVANLDEFTIEFWVRFDESNNTDYNVFYSANASDYGNRMNIYVSGPANGVEGKALVFLYNSSKKYLIGTTSIGNNRCHHIAFTYDNQACSLYVDGDLEATANHFFEFQSSDLHSLGQEFDKSSSPSSQFYNGELEDFRIWNYAKTQTEIEDHNNHELTGNEFGLLEYFNFNQGTANGNNTSISVLENSAPSNNNGTLENFNLNNTTSNFVNESCPVKTLGIESNEALNKIRISPNPTNGIININHPEILSSIDIKNSLGQTVLEPKPSSIITIEDLPKGCYFMQVLDKNGNNKTIKIIKK